MCAVSLMHCYVSSVVTHAKMQVTSAVCNNDRAYTSRPTDASSLLRFPTSPLKVIRPQLNGPGAYVGSLRNPGCHFSSPSRLCLLTDILPGQPPKHFPHTLQVVTTN